MRAIKSLTFSSVFSIFSLLLPALATAQFDGVDNAEQLFQKVREQLSNSGFDATSITIREVRQAGGGVAPAATRVLRELFARHGIKISTAANTEVEAYLENSGDEFIPPTLELRLLSDEDTRFESIGLSRRYYNTLVSKNVPGPAANVGPPARPDDNQKRKLGQKIEPIREWEVNMLDREALRFVRNALITQESNWISFWAYLNTGMPAPRIDFSKEYILVLTAPSDTAINVSLHDAGPGNLDIDPDAGYENVPPGNDPVNAAVFLLPKKIIPKQAGEQRVRLGVSIERSVSGDGLIIQGVDAGSPATKGISASGKGLALEKGDTILAINGSKTTDASAFIKSVQAAGTSIWLTVRDVNTGAINEIKFELSP